MDVNKVIENIDDNRFYFIDEENPFGINVVYYDCDELTWDNAVYFSNGFKALGCNDWRLPTVDEMKYLIENIFSQRRDFDCHSWTWCIENNNKSAKNIDIYDGEVDEDEKSIKLFVALIR